MSEVIQHQQTLPDVPAPSVATPAQLLEIAVRQDADIDKLERLMQLQERWADNEARKAFSAARSRLREQLPTISKSATVDFTNREGRRTYYKHATLAGMMEQIRPALTANGFDISWRTQVDGSMVIVTCILTHEMGHSEETSLPGPVDNSGGKNAIQGIGSTVKYLERYTAAALLGLADAEDDDGRAATPQKQAPAEPDAELVDRLTAAADEGTEALRSAWQSLTKTERAAVQGIMPGLKSRAAEVSVGTA